MTEEAVIIVVTFIVGIVTGLLIALCINIYQNRAVFSQRKREHQENLRLEIEARKLSEGFDH